MLFLDCLTLCRGLSAVIIPFSDFLLDSLAVPMESAALVVRFSKRSKHTKEMKTLTMELCLSVRRSRSLQSYTSIMDFLDLFFYKQGDALRFLFGERVF